MNVAYAGREQTAAKHFILRRYLQTLAFKLLQSPFGTVTYVDGFSGPWESQTADYSDTSFMIAIGVLKDAQARVRAQGKRKRINCFFVEEKASNFSELNAAVMLHHDPTNDFHVHTFHGRFEDAVDPIMKVVGSSFALTFIDPTGWTGYEFHKIANIMQHKPGEVLLNYMFDFINRFTASADAKTEASFDGILGANWAKRMDPSVSRDVAIQALFAEQFQSSGDFSYVLSTPIEKLSDRTHFSIVYGTRSAEGLSAYRDVEFAALKDHGMRRLDAKLALEQSKTGQYNMFSSIDLKPASPIEDQVAGQCVMARAWLLAALRANGPANFEDVWPPLLEHFMIRRTDAKRICAELAKERIIRESWKDGSSKRRTPDDDDRIELLTGLPIVR